MHSPGWTRYRLEVEPESELNLPGCSDPERAAKSVEDLTKRGEDIAACVCTPCSVRFVEVRMIKQVKELGTEIQVCPFREGNLLENGEVYLVVRRTIKRIASEISERTRCRQGVGSRVEKIIGPRSCAVLRYTRHSVGPLVCIVAIPKRVCADVDSRSDASS
jgi:hypothetical protein